MTGLSHWLAGSTPIEVWQLIVFVGAVAFVFFGAIWVISVHRKAKRRAILLSSWISGKPFLQDRGHVTPSELDKLREFIAALVRMVSSGKPAIINGRFGALGDISGAPSGIIRELPPSVHLTPVPDDLVAVLSGHDFYDRPMMIVRTDGHRCKICISRTGKDGAFCGHFTPPLDLASLPIQLCHHWRPKPLVPAKIETITIREV